MYFEIKHDLLLRAVFHSSYECVFDECINTYIKLNLDDPDQYHYGGTVFFS